MPNTIAESFRYFIQFYFSLVHDLSLSLSHTHIEGSLLHISGSRPLSLCMIFLFSLHDFYFSQTGREESLQWLERHQSWTIMVSPIPARRTISMAGHGLLRQKVWAKSVMEVSTVGATTRSPVTTVQTQASVPSSCCWATCCEILMSFFGVLIKLLWSFDKFDLGLCKFVVRVWWFSVIFW